MIKKEDKRERTNKLIHHVLEKQKEKKKKRSARKKGVNKRGTGALSV